jgi:lipid-A-disaccharide synthase
LRFVLPLVPGLRPKVEALLAGATGGAPITLVDGHAHDVLAACDVAIVASGTATLEAALYKRPMVITYVMNPITWLMMRPRNLQPWVGLPNILLGKIAVPELLQSQATPERLADEALAWLDDAPRAAALHAQFTQMHLSLRRNTAQAATDAIEKVLAR